MENNPKKFLSFFYLACLLLSISCTKKSKRQYKNTSNENQKLTTKGEYIPTKEDIEREAYFGYDTITIKSFFSKNNHKFTLKGSKSGDTYQIKSESNIGFIKETKLTDSWYIASHSQILWDNDDYLFIRFGCGTSCWGGQIISLNNDDPPREYMNYLYEDSVNNIIVYPDSNDYKIMIFENFDNEKLKLEKIYFCEESVTPIDYISCYSKENKHILIFDYEEPNCMTTVKKEIDIEQLID